MRRKREDEQHYVKREDAVRGAAIGLIVGTLAGILGTLVVQLLYSWI